MLEPATLFFLTPKPDKMEAIIFIIFLALVLILFIAAEYLDVTLHIAAFTILFLLGITVLTTNLEIKTGETTATEYTFLEDNVTVNETAEVRTAVYSSFDGTYKHLLGWIIAVVSVLGFVLVYVHYGKKRDKDNYNWNEDKS